jgi:hypothetical protein
MKFVKYSGRAYHGIHAPVDIGDDLGYAISGR